MPIRYQRSAPAVELGINREIPKHGNAKRNFRSLFSACFAVKILRVVRKVCSKPDHRMALARVADAMNGTVKFSWRCRVGSIHVAVCSSRCANLCQKRQALICGLAAGISIAEPRGNESDADQNSAAVLLEVQTRDRIRHQKRSFVETSRLAEGNLRTECPCGAATTLFFLPELPAEMFRPLPS